MSLGEILKDLRIESNLTQSELAHKLSIGQSTIVGYEKGEREATLTNLIRYAKFFNVSLDYLSGLEDDFGARTATSAAPMGESMTAEERELLSNFRELSPYLQGLTISTVKIWANKETGSKTKKA